MLRRTPFFVSERRAIYRIDSFHNFSYLSFFRILRSLRCCRETEEFMYQIRQKIQLNKDVVFLEEKYSFRVQFRYQYRMRYFSFMKITPSSSWIYLPNLVREFFSLMTTQKCDLKIRKIWQVADIMERIDAIYRTPLWHKKWRPSNNFCYLLQILWESQ